MGAPRRRTTSRQHDHLERKSWHAGAQTEACPELILRLLTTDLVLAGISRCSTTARKQAELSNARCTLDSQPPPHTHVGGDVLHARFFEANILCSEFSKKNQNVVTLQSKQKKGLVTNKSWKFNAHQKWLGKPFLPSAKKRDGQCLPNKMTAKKQF